MFFFIPVGMNYRTDRWPVVTLTLIGINTLIYIVSLICFLATEGNSENWIMENLWLIPAKSYIWMYLTSMFVHEGFFHLAGNMIFLFLFGCCVEDMVGRLRFAIFYLIGGLFAELVYIAMSPDHFAGDIPMGGASGAISTCMGMYLMLRAGADIDFKYFLWLYVYIRAGEFSLPAWVTIGFYFLSNLLWAVLGMADKSDHGGVAFGAHVGGFLAGFAIIGLYRWFGGRKLQDMEPEPELIIHPSEILAAKRMTAMTGLAHSGEVPTIFLHDGLAQTGPFTLSQIEAGLRSGSISREAVYWSEGMTEWQGVTELAGGLQ